MKYQLKKVEKYIDKQAISVYFIYKMFIAK